MNMPIPGSLRIWRPWAGLGFEGRSSQVGSKGTLDEDARVVMFESGGDEEKRWIAWRMRPGREGRPCAGPGLRVMRSVGPTVAVWRVEVVR